MSYEQKKLISIIIPCFNEGSNTLAIYTALNNVIKEIPYDFELIFINDGSTDSSMVKLRDKTKDDSRVRIIEFSRNFGKEVAVTAGINHCRGDACIIIDADLQHPPELIPEFLKKWQNGAEVVVGVRKKNKGEGFTKRIGSYIFYKIINKISHTEIVPYSTDYRLLDRIVIDEFNKLKEKNRITRGIIDWLGFKRDYVYFEANKRTNGQTGYNFVKLVRLAFSSFVSLSLFPLRLAGYLGIFITFLSGCLGLFIIIEKYILNDSMNINFSGSAILAVIILFLVGIILICLGLVALYIANIHDEVINRPLYVVRKEGKRN